MTKCHANFILKDLFQTKRFSRVLIM